MISPALLLASSRVRPANISDVVTDVSPFSLTAGLQTLQNGHNGLQSLRSGILKIVESLQTVRQGKLSEVDFFTSKTLNRGGLIGQVYLVEEPHQLPERLKGHVLAGQLAAVEVPDQLLQDRLGVKWVATSNFHRLISSRKCL